MCRASAILNNIVNFVVCKMAESEEQAPQVNVDDDVDTTPGYKPPAEKSMNDMLQQDAEDESLQKYKAQLLGSAASAETIFCTYVYYANG